MGLKFVADTMLGKLARWMKILGYDVIYFRQIDDKQLIDVSRQSGRIIVTRDRQLANIPTLDTFLIDSTDIWQQLKQVTKTYKLRFQETLFTRCTVCNGEIKPVKKSQVYEQLPTLVQRTQEEIYRCENCGKLYWEATHVKRIKRQLKENLGLDL